ncbi:MAG: AAA family ATPase [Hyphomicrobiaceae bacterium]|nr:AAA family ATPase [Hyphomicrobiaceae bacterium]
MQFTKLRILGFKTFVEPTDFRIEPGLTGVVGPNGCGKSNLVEALRWVMGENSYKSMRASGMDDVIFSGSGKRPARNTAEVTLFLDNSERRAPAAFNDIETLEVSRRIEREAGSVYRVNAREVRARDVQLLFADASTGSRSPALVRQGQIGELIAAKPAQRRAIIEEAAGISGLHSRRSEAESRLKAAEVNLERLGDVQSQIDSQLETLKRQARQASRYRALSADIRQFEAAQAFLRWVAAHDGVADAAEALTRATADMAARQEAQARAATAQAMAAHELPGLREAEARAAAGLARLKVAISEIDSEERRVAERMTELDARLSQLAGDIARERRLLDDNGEALARLDEEEAGHFDEAAAAEAQGEDARAALAEREAELARTDRALAEATAAAAEIQARRQQLDRAIREAEERAGRAEAQIAEVERELAAIHDRLAEAPEVSNCRALLDEAEMAAAIAEEAALEAEASTAERREAEHAARQPLADAEREVNRLETEARTLAAILQAATGDVTPILEAIRVETGLEAALGAALGDDLDAGTDPDQLVHWGDSGPGDGDPPLPAGARPLARFVEAPDLLDRRLAQIGLVDRADGARLATRLRPGQRLVSIEGDLWRWDGYRAAADAPTAAAQRLAQKNRLAEIEAATRDARAGLIAHRRAFDAAGVAARAAIDAERVARERWRQEQRRVGEAREALARAERDMTQVTARLSALEEARARLSVSRDEAHAAHATATAQLAATPPSEGLTQRLIDLRTEVATARAGVAEARAIVGTLMREAELRARRLEAIGRERRAWTERAGNAEAQIEILEARGEDMQAEKLELEDRPPALAAQRRRLLQDIAEAETVRRDAADHLARGETTLADTDRAARQALEALTEARVERGRAEERQFNARAREAEIVAHIRDEFESSPIELAAIAGLGPDDEIPEIGAIETRLERLHQERERLGGVNLRAEEEARAIEERRDSLAREREDLETAIARLRGGISSLNREARERLLASFETVDAHFRRLFTRLFNGGEAELRLVDSDDPLDAGLEIFARPPGKKPQTMTLLSGGEQALTAMALIFAVFLTNPAPICVLDEVDAPLDDANVERYCDLLDSMSADTRTRFIVITHNPITMARMDRLFGVTMAEKGVSQLVSVDLATAERFIEAA